MAELSSLEVTELFRDLCLERIRDVDFYRSAQNKGILQGTRLHAELPYFQTAKEVAHLEELSSILLSSLKQIPNVIFGGDYQKASEELNIEFLRRPLVQRLLALPEFVKIARPDTIPSNGPKFLEQNITSGVGGYQQVEAARNYFEHHPAFQELASRFEIRIPNYVQSFVDLIVSLLPADSTVAVLDAEQPGGQPFDGFGALIHRYLKRAGIKAFFCHPSSLSATSNGVKYFQDRISHIIRIEILETFLSNKEFNPLWEACADQAVTMIGSAHEILLWDKQLLSYLSDSQTNSFLSPEFRQKLGQCLPWTRRVSQSTTEYNGKEISLPDFLLEEKNRWILKQGGGCLSENLVIGKFQTQETWEEAIANALFTRNWVVQEFIETNSIRSAMLLEGKLIDYSYDPVVSPYMVADKLSGGLVRTFGYRGTARSRTSTDIIGINTLAVVGS